MTYESEFNDTPEDEIELDRSETFVRLLYTLVFYFVANVAEAVLVVLVLFQLGFALITQRKPGPELRHFANQTISYLVHVGRYLTYNDEQPPFPFREFPAELNLEVPLEKIEQGY